MQFKTVKEARENGYYHIHANAVLTEYSSKVGSRRLVCRDISGGNSFGYGFTIIVQEMKKCPETGFEDWEDLYVDEQPVTTSVFLSEERNKVGQPGCFSARFKMSDIENLARLRLRLKTMQDLKFRMFNFK